MLTDFKVRNETFSLDSSITAKKNICLKHDQNFFSIEFAALDFIDPKKNQYAYYLEGYEDGWIYSGDIRTANYTGVPSGEYIFHVKGSNSDGYWNEAGTSLLITILYPFWKTWWAYLLYILLFVSTLYLIFRFYLRRQKLINDLYIRDVEAQKLKEVDSMKSRFFANLSHEFRTPLTLILGPIEKLKSTTQDDTCLNNLTIMQKNAFRLQHLINQLLALSKFDEGKMKLQAVELNIVKLVDTYMQSFESLARQRKIKLTFNSNEENIPVFVDRDKLEKILYNLLSNAFKFTGEEGRIEVLVTPHPSPLKGGDFAPSFKMELSGGKSPLHGGFGGVEIRISDTGRGIPPDKLKHIFDRFYQADDSYSKDMEGTGIGLALTKELVEIHSGTISVESTQEKGTTFTIFLLLGKEHLKPEEIVEEGVAQITGQELYSPKPLAFIETQEDIEPESGKHIVTDDSLPILLIVEDNAVMRSFICSYLDKLYNIIESVDGVDGFEKATTEIPDLILSDVMMPGMDGMEFCRKIKTDERTSHIPVILLTARAAIEDKLEGLETGADDFITKPFHSHELLVRIKNLIFQRHKLREQFIKEFDIAAQMMSKDLLSMDRQFLQKAKEVIEENISNFEFNVEMFAKAMGLSRTQLHRKLKALINQSASDFLKAIRLNQAANLLKSKSGNITQIAFEVGFNNLSYFSKCFRDQFGMLPSEYANQNSKT